MNSSTSIRPAILLGCACLLASCGGGAGKSDSSAVAPPQALETDSTIVMTDGHGVFTLLNLNDNTVEGIAHKTLPVFSVQYHPEAAPGPRDPQYLFRDFKQMIASRGL